MQVLIIIYIIFIIYHICGRLQYSVLQHEKEKLIAKVYSGSMILHFKLST